MTICFLRSLVVLTILSGCASPSRSPEGATTADSRSPASPKSGAAPPAFAVSLFPKSFQPNPVLDMTVFTEMTAAGRKLPQPTQEEPVYYVAQAEGFKQWGTHMAGEKPPSAGQMDYFVRKALASRGYRSAPSREVRPTLMILYRWGSHNALGGSESEDFQRMVDSDVLERARLVGGNKLLREIDRQMEWGETLLDNGDKARYLKEQAFNSCYFVALSAYDYEAMIRGERRLYWRTNMTVSTDGVSLRETLPPLIASAAPFLGKETAEPEITTRALRGREKIEIGPVVSLEDEEALPAAEPPKNPAKETR